MNTLNTAETQANIRWALMALYLVRNKLKALGVDENDTAMVNLGAAEETLNSIPGVRDAAGVAGARAPLTDQQIVDLVPNAQSGWSRGQYCQWMARAVERAHGIGTPGVAIPERLSEITPEMMTEAAKRVGFDPVPGRLTRLAGVLNAMLAAGVKEVDRG